MPYYLTRHDSMTQAVNVYVNLDTATDGTTLAPLTVPQGYNRISRIISAVSIDGAIVLDVAAAFFLKLAGKGLVEGDQELLLSNINSVEVGTSVGEAIETRPADIKTVNIFVKPNNQITLQGAYQGTDAGTPFMSVTLEFDR